MAVFWARVLCHLVVEEARFRMRVTLGFLRIRSLVYTKNMFRDVSGAVPEWPWISGFVRKSSRRANAPSTRFSVLLNCCDNFLVTLPSISSETWVMLSSCDLGTFKFCAKLPLGYSLQFSLLKAASFLLFRVAFSTGKAFSVVNNWLCFLERKIK